MTLFCLLIFRIVSAALANVMDQAGRLINERKQPAGSRRRPLRLGWLYILTASIITPGGNPMSKFVLEPIQVNSSALKGACVLRTSDDIGTFILLQVDIPHRRSPHWEAVTHDLVHARFGARQAEVYAATRDALSAEGWLAKRRHGPGLRSDCGIWFVLAIG